MAPLVSRSTYSVRPAPTVTRILLNTVPSWIRLDTTSQLRLPQKRRAATKTFLRNGSREVVRSVGSLSENQPSDNFPSSAAIPAAAERASLLDAFRIGSLPRPPAVFGMAFAGL